MDRRNFLQGLGSVAVTGALAEQASAAFPTGRLVSNKPLSSKPVVKVCGIGSGGSNIVNHLMAMGVEGVTEYVCIAADKSDLDRCTAHGKLLIGHGDSDKRSTARKLMNPLGIRALLDGANVVVLIAGLGGDAEATIATYVASHARKSGQQVASLLLMPFHQDIDKEIGARHGMVSPQISSHVSMVISTEAIRASLGHQRTMAEYLAATDNAVLRALQAILAMTTSGPGLLRAAPEEASRASARIHAAELLREVERCAVETEVAIYELKWAAGSLREEMSNLEGATNNHYLASDAFHSSQADVYAANASIRSLEVSERAVESQAKLRAMVAERDQMARTLRERREVLESAAGELARRISNSRVWKSHIERARELISWWSEDLKERFSELKSSATRIGDERDVSKSVAHATTVLVRANSALRDVEVSKLVQAVEKNLSAPSKVRMREEIAWAGISGPPI